MAVRYRRYQPVGTLRRGVGFRHQCLALAHSLEVAASEGCESPRYY
jgi:hypothetical protein